MQLIKENKRNQEKSKGNQEKSKGIPQSVSNINQVKDINPAVRIRISC